MGPLEYAAKICYSSLEVLLFTYDQAKKYKDSPACFVETGCAAGAQVIAMRHGAPNQQIYAFDSFCGLPWPSNRDDQMPGIRMLSKWEQKALPNPGQTLLESTGAVCVSVGDFEQHIVNAFGNTNNVIPIKGWFEDTVKHFDKPISLLRLDGDLYNSTYVCLESLYPKCIKGACVIIDDIQLPGCKAACDDYFLSIDYKPKYKYVDNVAYFIK
jgi:hypothetical protein